MNETINQDNNNQKSRPGCLDTYMMSVKVFDMGIPSYILFTMGAASDLIM